MKVTLKKIVYLSLIGCYSLVTTVGNVIVLKELLNSGNKYYQLTSEKKSRSIPDSPVWTVKTHVIPILHSDISEHNVPSAKTSLLNKQSTIFVNVEIALIYSSLEFLPSKPRDPPLV